MHHFTCPCDSCGKVFVRKADLSRHYQIHTNERPFICPDETCNKSFNQRSALKVHQRVHSGEKPYVCEVESCQRAFADASTYARHRRAHNNEKPYVCSIASCNRRFSRKSALNRHQLLPHAEYTDFEPQTEIVSPPTPLQSNNHNLASNGYQPRPHFDHLDTGDFPPTDMSDEFISDELFEWAVTSTATPHVTGGQMHYQSPISAEYTNFPVVLNNRSSSWEAMHEQSTYAVHRR